ncbi:HlyC/CorC family transporter [Parvibaculum sp.]|jgi:Mg2+/Co2+ transporter CorB|uniref:HlyC/CorC family transporter n=1 Tax=Parvibaculum sp. TaxID=2024848 RepID=UPI001B15ACF2|nr:HlyC/CorC family transporter [Parvibaculum sp.]MBO6635323.1 HlyC/CorC family transporter [Parvibaculum sp.]MBO6676988.1 HlyC/CorC family transporter [Parvibaculum sp.]MBO6683488.1 HlyC/CorC family transporter [Parvibaculum sp.]MBO6905441.1 HlyC/CorC family transporter [Parvibaculum sp.]
MLSFGLGVILGAIVLLLLFSAFFSGSETALTAASRARMHHLAEDGNKRARTVLGLTEDRERLIGAILLGNNLVNILASALATSLFLALFGDAGVVYATLVMTAVVLIFAEVAPKTFAITNTDRVALAVSGPLRLITVLFGPVTAAVQFIVRHTFRVFGLNVDDSQQVLSAHEELRGAINLHHHEGSVVKIDRDMLGGILDLRDLEVSDIMVHRKNIVMIDAGQKNSEIISQALASPHTRIPLWRDEQENIVGILHAKDLLRALSGANWQPDTIDILSIAIKPWFVPDTTTLQDQLNAFLRQKTHFALVVDEYGALMGLITLEDILEEIVGDISDEHDIEVAGVRMQPDGSVVVSGSVPIRDLNRAFDWSLPDDEATTIAGLVIHEARTIPEIGQAFTFHDFRFEILRRHRNQISQIRISTVRSTKAGAAE